MNCMFKEYQLILEEELAVKIKQKLEIEELKQESINIKSKISSLTDTNKFLCDELDIKKNYSKELETTIDDMIKSNKFYEDQLLQSDEVVRLLKEKQTKNSIDYALQIERLKKQYLKENGVLKLKIMELTLELEKLRR